MELTELISGCDVCTVTLVACLDSRGNTVVHLEHDPGRALAHTTADVHRANQ